MRQVLRPGAELEAATPGEVRDLLDELERNALARQPAVVRAEDSFVTDASGNVRTCVYKVPLGMSLRVTRVQVLLDGFTPAVPFNGAGAWLEVLRNDVMVDFRSLVAGAAGGASLPALLQANDRSTAPWLANGDELAVSLNLVTASRGGVVRIEGELEPIVNGN